MNILSIILEYAFVFIILSAFTSFLWRLYLFLGVKFSKTLATIVDFITSSFMAGWLVMNDHYILATIGMVLLIKQNLDKTFQKRLSDVLEADRKKYLDNEETT
jgi:hypothetical protein